jgi:hypothetical protein
MALNTFLPLEWNKVQCKRDHLTSISYTIFWVCDTAPLKIASLKILNCKYQLSIIIKNVDWTPYMTVLKEIYTPSLSIWQKKKKLCTRWNSLQEHILSKNCLHVILTIQQRTKRNFIVMDQLEPITANLVYSIISKN